MSAPANPLRGYSEGMLEVLFGCMAIKAGHKLTARGGACMAEDEWRKRGSPSARSDADATDAERGGARSSHRRRKGKRCRPTKKR